MAFSVLNNPSGLQAQNELSVNVAGLNKTLYRLSSGKRINTGADDAAGLAIADGLKGQINGLNQAVRNASDGVGYLQIADGAMAQVTTLLHRAVTLAESAATSTNSASLATINSEYTAIKSEIDRIKSDTYYNATQVFSATLTVFVGDTKSTSSINADTTSWNISTGSGGLALGGASALNTMTGAQSELSSLREALSSVAGYRGKAGAYVNRLSSAMTVIMAQSQNLVAAESQIRDANMAEEVANLTKYQILNQAGMSALAQSNASAQQVLTLLR